VRAFFDVHGIRLDIEADHPELLEAVARDLRHFARAASVGGETTNGSDGGSGAADMRVRFVCGVPPWGEVPLGTLPLFRTANNTVYRVGRRRYVDHGGRALVRFDPRRDEATVWAPDGASLHEVAYLLLLSRLGDRLDARGLHRLHAMAIAVEGRAVVILADSGCGKTSLGLSMMRHERVRWLSDEIPLLDAKGWIHPFPLPPRLTVGSPVPWPAPDVDLLPVSRRKKPPKVALDNAWLLPRLSPAAAPVAVVHATRSPDVPPSIVRIGRLANARLLARNAVLGRDLPQTKPYWLPLRPDRVAVHLARRAKRARAVARLARRVPAFRFRMGSDLDDNTARLVELLRRELDLDPGPATDPGTGASAPVEPSARSEPTPNEERDGWPRSKPADTAIS